MPKTIKNAMLNRFRKVARPAPFTATLSFFPNFDVLRGVNFHPIKIRICECSGYKTHPSHHFCHPDISPPAFSPPGQFPCTLYVCYMCNKNKVKINYSAICLFIVYFFFECQNVKNTPERSQTKKVLDLEFFCE